jgi:uncharacterized membrane protein HdeD (DUF308 family)
MFDHFDVLVLKVTPEMIQHWGWFLAFGLVIVLLGISAITRSVGTTVVSTAFFGWLLMIAGAIEFVDAFLVGNWAGFLLHLLIAILFAVAGVVMLTSPVISAEAATFLMSMFFLIGGIYQLVSSLVTHIPGWGWQATDGIVASILGFLLLAQWPVSGLYAIGLFIGIDLVVFGVSWAAFALDLHKLV